MACIERNCEKIDSEGKSKNCKNLLPWIQSVFNHLWWSSHSCNGDAQVLKEKWMSVTNHIVNVHSWEHASVFVRCEHAELSSEEFRRKKWLKSGSPAHEALKLVVFEKRLLNDIKKVNQVLPHWALRGIPFVDYKVLSQKTTFWV